MSETRHEGGVIHTVSDEQSAPKLEWRTPRLTVLGDATAQTRASASGSDDGALLSS